MRSLEISIGDFANTLLWLLRSRSDSTQLTRWCIELQVYDFQIVHHIGKKHQNADALSQPPFVLFGEGLPLADTALVSFQSLAKVDVITAAYNKCIGNKPLPEPDEYEEFVAASTCAHSADAIGPSGDITSHAAVDCYQHTAGAAERPPLSTDLGMHGRTCPPQ